MNLYLASTLEWEQDGARLSLEQRGDYPATEHIVLHLTASRSAGFSLHLRVPAWCEAAGVRVNGHPLPSHVERGFLRIHRTWRHGDRIDLNLPAKLRLEPLPANSGAQYNYAALCWGPWMLMPLAPSPTARESDPLRAERVAPDEWRVRRPEGDLYLPPFFAVGSETYATHTRLV